MKYVIPTGLTWMSQDHEGMFMEALEFKPQRALNTLAAFTDNDTAVRLLRLIAKICDKRS